MQKISVSTRPDSVKMVSRPTLQLSQGDVGREFVISLYQNDVIPSGATIKLQGTKPSGLGFSITGVPNDNDVSFVSTAEMTDEYGKFPVELKITSGSMVLGSANFNLDIEENPHPDGTTDGRSEEVIPRLTVLVERVEAVAESIHDLSVEASTLPAGSDATATYDSEENKLEIGVPKGQDGYLLEGALTFADENAEGNVVISFIGG